MKQSNDYDYQFVTTSFRFKLTSIKTEIQLFSRLCCPAVKPYRARPWRKIRTENKNFNFAPSARFVYNFARSHSLTATYGGQAGSQASTQLQPVSDSSNIKNIVTGNPKLNPEFTNTFSLQYNKVGILTGTSLFTNISFDQTQNRIVTSRINDTTGTGRTTTYLNTNGFYGFNGNISYHQPFANRKFSATVSASANYDNNISFLDR